MERKKQKVFLTGGSGLLGQALLDSRQNEEIIALCHNSTISHPNVQQVQGDIRKPLLGMKMPEYAMVADNVDVIIHSAAITHFGVRDHKIFETNIEGTKEVVKLAKITGARLIYVSTAFIHHKASNVEPSSLYEESKRKAESIVKELGSSYIIIRPSIIIGNSKTGQIATYQGFHHVVGTAVDRSLPVIPADPNMFIDFVAQDWVTDAIWGAVHHPKPAEELWITCGKHALTIEAIVSIATCVGESYGFTGDIPKIVPYETLQRLFIPVFLDKLPSSMQRQFRANIKLARYMNQVEHFPSSETYLETEFNLLPRESIETVLFRNMERWALKRIQSYNGRSNGKHTSV